jgi:23S rRNA (cytosine1962-C5)-methyltransferase
MISNLHILTAESWDDYELIDAGGFEKLERFGPYVTIRPEPQAIWDKTLSDKEWLQRAHVKFVGLSSSSGKWDKLKPMPDNWTIHYPFHDGKRIAFNLAMTKFKHVGIFPEQRVNWDFIYQKTNDLKKKHEVIPVLNLFAYTGGSSLAARAAGADVYHVDAIKQVVSWANRNMQSSGLADIRWVVEDAVKFVKRELRRGRKYRGIILDPPAFGHGPDGESWKLESMINDLLKDVFQILEPEDSFLVLNTYSLGLSALVAKNLVEQNLAKLNNVNALCDAGEICIQSTAGPVLPLGIYVRLG